MAPKVYIHCVRHAQGYHNLSTANHLIPDPLLTPLGEEQCAALAASFPHHSKITHLVSSPLRRTLYTTLLSFPSEVESGMKIIALPELQETSDLPCDTGSRREALEAEFGEKVDLGLVQEGWNNKIGKWSPAASAIEQRAHEARVFLRRLAASAASASTEKEIHIAVVTHGGFLHYFTEDWNGHEKFLGTGWANTEWRSYEFESEDDAMASLRETEESRNRRGEKPLSEAEQRNLKASAEREWSESGYQTPRELEKQEPVGEAVEVTA